MKPRHNKKRNTAFLFEVLVLELTQAVVSQDRKRAQRIKEIFKNYFGTTSTLHQEVQCYRSLGPGQSLDERSAEKLLFLAKQRYQQLDRKKIFQEQTHLIKEMHRHLGRHVFTTFVKEYKNYASLSQIFGSNLPPQQQMLLEQRVVQSLIQEPEQQAVLLPVDSLVIKTFTDNFNTKYKHLLPEQTQLLRQYTLSLSPEDLVEFKVMVSHELTRIHGEITDSLSLTEVKEDPEMTANTQKVLRLLEDMNVGSISDTDLLQILKLQHLVSEYKS